MMEISAITFGLPQAAAPVPEAAAEGLFLAVMSELGAWSTDHSVVEEVERPTTFTLLNPNSFKATSLPGDETADVQLEHDEDAERLLPIVVPSTVQPLPVAPLTMNLKIGIDRWVASTTTRPEEQDDHAGSESSLREASLTGNQDTEEAVPIERGGRALKGELAFAARVSKQPELPQALAMQPEVQVQLERVTPDKQEAAANGQLRQLAKTADQPIERSTETCDPAPPIKAHQETATTLATVSNANQPAHEMQKNHHVDTPANLVDIEAPLQPRATGSVREVAIAIDGAEGRVRLRMETHSGELRASVTGSSPETVERVRAELPDLARSLKDSGFKSELWTPNSVKQAGAVSELHAGSEHGQRGFGADDHQREDDSRRRRPQPDWLEAEDE